MSALVAMMGPLGLSPKMVHNGVAEVSGNWKGIMVSVGLTFQNRQAQIEVVLFFF
jgi:large subunit ribosomal protein L12e